MESSISHSVLCNMYRPKCLSTQTTSWFTSPLIFCNQTGSHAIPPAHLLELYKVHLILQYTCLPLSCQRIAGACRSAHQYSNMHYYVYWKIPEAPWITNMPIFQILICGPSGVHLGEIQLCCLLSNWKKPTLTVSCGWLFCVCFARLVTGTCTCMCSLDTIPGHWSK